MMTKKDLRLIRAWAIAVTRSHWRRKPVIHSAAFNRFACGPIGKAINEAHAESGGGAEILAVIKAGREHAVRDP